MNSVPASNTTTWTITNYLWQASAILDESLHQLGGANPHYSRVTEWLVVQAFSSVMTQMDAGVMTIEAMRRPVG